MASALRYWTQRRLSRAGMGVLVAVVVAGIMGPDSENNVAYQAFTLLVVLLVIGVCCTCIFRGRFSAKRSLPRFGTAGNPLRYRVTVRNLTKRTQGSLTFLETLADPRPSFADWRAAKMVEDRNLRSFRVGR